MSAQASKLTLEPVQEFGELPSFRNIRFFADEDCLRLHCIEAKTIPARKLDTRLIWLEPSARHAIEDSISGEIVEGEKVLSLEFLTFLAWITHEEFFSTEAFDLSGLTEPSSMFRVVGSPWTAGALDYWTNNLGKQPADLHHLRIISMTTYVDVLSTFPEGRWIDNRRSYDNLTANFG